jgi:hypothetical protein
MSNIHRDRDIDTIVQVYNSIAENFKGTPSEYHHTLRTILDPFIFNYLRETYLHTLQSFWFSSNIPKLSEKAICIVERRCHPNFEFCLLNAAYFAQGYSIYIFCSDKNYAFIKGICSPHIENIHIFQVFEGFGTPDQGKTEYNELLMKTSFWERIDAKYVLTIETDTYLLDHIPEYISDFDYVASKWTWDLDAPGGGGLSFRNRDMMLQFCSDSDLHDQMQDSFASNGVKKYGYLYPDPQAAKHFFSESDFYSQPIGVHQWWTFLSEHLAPVKQCIEKFTTLNIEVP